MHYRPREIEVIDKEIGTTEIETPAGYVWDIFMKKRGPMRETDVLAEFKSQRESVSKKEEGALKQAIKKLSDAGFLHELAGQFYPLANKV
ncbi:MAG: hypothetical protein ABH829_03445 [archaeon]